MPTRRSIAVRLWFVAAAIFVIPHDTVKAADAVDPNADREHLPTVPDGFAASLFAREPLVRQPCSLAFDRHGRLFVGMGPQFRMPKPDTPGDSVVIVLDTDGDGRADATKVFATGFNCVQGLAWKGRDLWVANSPDLTVVRDLDGDDEADEYVKVYTDLGNLEHGLHGLNWAPDGKLYMSKGNSKGLTQPGRIAPKPFRDLWGAKSPPDAPDFPEPQTFRKGEYRRAYHDPADDWGREGGVLRCDDGGRNLEIVSRGFRNPWDVTFDSGFHWLGTDNDQTTGDRVFMPFRGAHFGWNHPWSSHWNDEPHPPTAPVSGPLFEGSGTGIVYVDGPQFPASHRHAFFVNDWLRKTTFVWRPRWDGALLRPQDGDWEPFAKAGDALYRPTDLEVGPDGALWVLSWGSGYGSEHDPQQSSSQGRVVRIASKSSPPADWKLPQRSKPHADWTVTELVADFAGPLPIWRTDAQDELVRRGTRIKGELQALLREGNLVEARETWTAWTLGRLDPADAAIDAFFEKLLAPDSASSLNLRIQAVRILAHRVREFGRKTTLPDAVVDLLSSSEPRMRFAAVQALAAARQTDRVTELTSLLATETDPTTFYAAWQALRELTTVEERSKSLTDARGGVRRGALLSLLEDHALKREQIAALAQDVDPGVRDVASLALNGRSARPTTPSPRRPSGLAPIVASGAGLVRKIAARSGAVYRIVPGGLRPGALPYTDRSYVLKQVPAGLLGADFLQTANGDDGSKGDAFLAFEASLPVRLHVALDARLPQPPAWVRDGFRPSELAIQADHWTFRLHQRDFPAGRIELGGNTDDGRAGGKGNYIVVLEPLPIPSPSVPVTVDEALASLPQGDAARGETLFHLRGGVGCVNCHRLGDPRRNIAPDLSSIGQRATPRHIVQSLLEPSAQITEGFQMQLIVTDAGLVRTGILLEESGLAVTLGQANGERLTIERSRIELQKSTGISAMPSYAPVLPVQHVADLAAFLLTQKSVTSTAPAPAAADPKPSATPPALTGPTPSPTVVRTIGAEPGFVVVEKTDRLVISFAGKSVTEFVFRDPKILRPFFANVHAPDGTKATRNHPPIGGDSSDHDTMHPGFWLGLGDVSGEDFWRNRGRIEHVAFAQPPMIKEDRLDFATECRLRTAAGATLCTLTNRCAIVRRPAGWRIEWDATFRSDDGEFAFGDQEEMGFGARVATPLIEKNGGTIRNAYGVETAKATWGQPAAWCDYSGVVGGRRVGITLLPHPENFRESWWHNRDYGVFVANPFGRAAMRQGERSRVVVKRGDAFRLRCAAVFHAGENHDPAAELKEYVGSTK